MLSINCTLHPNPTGQKHCKTNGCVEIKVLWSQISWEIALKVRREQLKNTVRKILTLPLSFYDEYNPGRITNRISKGVENQLWTYPEIAGQLIPKFIRVLGIFVIILLIEAHTQEDRTNASDVMEKCKGATKNSKHEAHS